jgi:2-dehydropantoate 2-reductase
LKDASEPQKKALQDVEQLLRQAGLQGFLAEDIELEVWRKYILNCAYNVASAAYDNTMGQLREDPVRAKEYEALVDEAYQVALAKHVAVTPDHRQAIIDQFYNYRYDATSSLQRDLNAGRQGEIQTFSGYLVSEARRLGVPAPVSEKMYGLLKARAEKR